MVSVTYNVLNVWITNQIYIINGMELPIHALDLLVVHHCWSYSMDGQLDSTENCYMIYTINGM